MSDKEIEFRSQDDYISKYRRVLDYFDAVKIGLTATPALHTTEIFGKAIFIYSYREAVIDGYLIDHEPPVRIETALARAGIGFSEGEEVEFLAPETGEDSTALIPDEVNFEVEQFNRQVITEPFNQAVAEELAKHIDPALDDGFTVFVTNPDNLNAIAALKVVVQRPRDLTRADLRALRLALDEKGYSEAKLRRAWADAKNQDIAASIIGYVRQAALGGPLVPYADRVRAAMQEVLASRTWSDPQPRGRRSESRSRHRRADRSPQQRLTRYRQQRHAIRAAEQHPGARRNDPGHLDCIGSRWQLPRRHRPFWRQFLAPQTPSRDVK
jgi:type I site-specific restriction endonuclease